MEIRQIFLSYSRPDQDQVEQIARRLDQEGYKIWYDQAKIVPGESWSDALDRGLRESSHCLVFVGPGEVRPWQQEEIRTAINSAITQSKTFRLIPVLLPGVRVRPGDSELPSFLTNRQWVEFRESLDNEDDWHLLVCGLQGKEPGLGLPAGQAGACPYKGLAVFGIQDAPYFYGREAVTDTILPRLRERITQADRPRFFAVIGPSGTGKSSLVRAGVLAGITEGRRLDDCGTWIRDPLIFKPGDTPLNSLAKMLIGHEATRQRFSLWSVADVEKKLRQSTNGESRFLTDEVETVIPAGTYLPVLVDQFEEMLKPLARRDTPGNDTQAQIDAYKRDQFLPFVRNLAFAARQARGRLVFIVTMRDDFYGLCGSDEAFGALISENHKLLSPMSTAELRNAVEQPARNSGKAVQPALLTLIENDMRNRPGALPLLQETLEQLWHSSGNTLTSDAYTTLGGIAGSLKNKADNTYKGLMEAMGPSRDNRRREGIIRRIFLDLVNRGNGIASSRRRERDELPDAPDTGPILDAFVNAHLLLESGDKNSGKSYYELTHEALIEHWSMLADWLRGEEEDDRHRQQLEGEANRWSRAQAQHIEQPTEWQQLESEYLLKGKRWQTIAQWLKASEIPVSKLADQFVGRCRNYAEEQRHGRRKRGLLAFIGLVLMLAVIGIGYFYLTHTHLDLSVQNTDGEAIGDYEIYLSKDRATLDTSLVRWFSPGLLEPDRQYWLKVKNKDYFSLARKIQTAHAGETSDVKVSVFPFQKAKEPEMLRIEGGRFQMGSYTKVDSEAQTDEQPRHEVTIKAFHIGKYEVTFAEYDAFAKAIQQEPPDDEGWGRSQQPVINVNWQDAIDYAQWLSNQTGKHYRLPTEAEWEYVARAATDTGYWWGNDIRQDGKVWANCDGCGSEWVDKRTAQVGSFEPNAFGVYDTAGNVWEWVQDCWHPDYQGAPADGSAWLEADKGDCNQRVIRGGSWSDEPRALRSAYRFGDYPGLRDNFLGFRLAQDVE